jgi:hypothetical protein
MKLWRTFFDDSDRQLITTRLRSLKPDAKPRWGKMNAPRMVAHLMDQMHHCLGDVPVKQQSGFLSLPPVRFLSIYVVPWPKGRVQGPPEAYVTQPASWDKDVSSLVQLVERFALQDPDGEWPNHALMGRMTGHDWGVFCHKHFNHHLSQFGA